MCILTAIKEQLNTIEKCGLPVDQPAALLKKLADIVEREMGGSSGAVSIDAQDFIQFYVYIIYIFRTIVLIFVAMFITTFWLLYALAFFKDT